jgi:hypothetical protein
MKKLLTCIIWMSCILYLPADNISPKIRLNGFLSQGFVYTTDNDLIPNSGKYGSFDFSELGLTFSMDISENLTMGLQLLSRDYGNVGNFDIKLDWAFADYNFSDAFGIRFGRIKTPIGFYNDIRDIDSLRPLALLPQSVYDEHMRPVFVAHNGIDLYGLLDLGMAGSLDYVFFYGTIYHPTPKEGPYILQIQQTFNNKMNKIGLNLSEISLESEIFCGGRIIWDIEDIGLKLGGTYIYHNAKLKTRLDNMTPWAQTYPFISIKPSGHMELLNCFFLSGELKLGNLTITSEYMELLPELRMKMFGAEEEVMDDDTMQGFYVMLSYMFGDRLTLTALYDQFYGQKGDKEGKMAVESGNPNFFGWRKDLTLGLRYDISFNWMIKFEYHLIDGLSKSFLFSDPDDYKQKWNMFIAKFSFNF